MGAVSGIFAASGQTCIAPKRIFVHRSIYGEFLERFVERTSPVGPTVFNPKEPVFLAEPKGRAPLPDARSGSR